MSQPWTSLSEPKTAKALNLFLERLGHDVECVDQPGLVLGNCSGCSRPDVHPGVCQVAVELEGERFEDSVCWSWVSVYLTVICHAPTFVSCTVRVPAPMQAAA